ncbi:class I SAM-dependent methyltransferase [Natronincola ferrireducens]|uniref:Phospholipid N-methyltransferase n=1 Tax=Natronincola ferrireducens TaxID=393762 RepID=A0A1G9II75_9FIRM|nr:rRNA adenine N-6-methyltransferase family protein [Natronincola ferrireducens]SDL24939.1 Phospholipid N-methyltransferase [Natronincola ferrireducens]
MFKFLKEFVKKPRLIGAIAPSSKYLTEKMIENIDFLKSECIIEYGAGTGVFTEKLLARMKDDTLLLVFENNRNFYQELVKHYGHKKNVKIINDSAENVVRYMNEYNLTKVDYIVSGIPFASLPFNIAENILKDTKKILAAEGKFITFQYSLIKLQTFKIYFREINYKKVILNIPPAYVLNCRVQEEI